MFDIVSDAFIDWVPLGPYVQTSRFVVSALLLAGAVWSAWGAYKSTGSVLGGQNWRSFALTQTVIIGSVAFLLWNTRAMAVKVTGDSLLIVAGPIYSVRLALDQIALNTVETHGRSARPDLAVRTNGLALPGYTKGWFRSASGRSTFAAYGVGAYVSFQDRDGVLYVIGSHQPDKLAATLAMAERR